MRCVAVAMGALLALTGCPPKPSATPGVMVGEPLGTKAPAFAPSADGDGFRKFVVGKWSAGYDRLDKASDKSEVVALMRDTVSQTLVLKADGAAELETNDGTAFGTWDVSGTSVRLKMDSGSGFPFGEASRRARRLNTKAGALGDLTLHSDGQRLVQVAAADERSAGTNFGLVWERLAE